MFVGLSVHVPDIALGVIFSSNIEALLVPVTGTIMVVAKRLQTRNSAQIAGCADLRERITPPSAPDAISILRGCMEILGGGMASIDPTELERSTGLLWARKLDYTYASKMKSRELEHDARKAAAYLLVDQILFYHLLSLNDPHYAALREIRGNKPEDLARYFDLVPAGDYKAIFDFKILECLPQTLEMVHALNNVIQTIITSRVAEVKQDILGKVFHGLIPAEIRRHLAAFYTSNEAASLLAHLAINQWDETILDLACGSGTLLTAAYLRKKALALQTGRDQVHRIILAQIFGNDVAHFAAHLATMNLAVQDSLACNERINVTVADGFTISLATLMHYSDKFKIHKANVDGTGDNILDFRGIDIVFMNPPFTQHKRLDEVEKARIFGILRQEGYGKYLNGRMGLHALFVLHADLFLPVGGKLALVLPANTFSSAYGKKILQLFQEKNYSIDFVIEKAGASNAFSEQCGLKEYLIVATKGLRQSTGDTSCLVTLSSMPQLEDIPQLAELLKERTARGPLPGYLDHMFFLPQDLLLEVPNWNALFQQNSVVHDQPSFLNTYLQDPSRFISLRVATDFKVRRGFDGTHIEELSFPNKSWSIATINADQGITIEQNGTGEQLFIGNKFLSQSFRKPRLYDRIFYPAPNEYLLVIPPNKPLPPSLARYVELTTKTLKRRRSREKKEGSARAKIFNTHWYTHAARFNCQTRIGHLWLVWKFNIKTRRGFGFFAEQPGVAHNAFYQIQCANPAWEPLVAAWLNSSLWVFQLMTHSRSLTSQYHQLMIEDIKDTFFPQLSNLDPKCFDKILAAARALDQIQRDSFRELFLAGDQELLDRSWLAALQVMPEEQEIILRELRSFFQIIFSRI